MVRLQVLFSFCTSLGIEFAPLGCLHDRAFVNSSLLDGLDNKRVPFEDLGSKVRLNYKHQSATDAEPTLIKHQRRRDGRTAHPRNAITKDIICQAFRADTDCTTISTFVYSGSDHLVNGGMPLNDWCMV